MPLNPHQYNQSNLPPGCNELPGESAEDFREKWREDHIHDRRKKLIKEFEALSDKDKLYLIGAYVDPTRVSDFVLAEVNDSTLSESVNAEKLIEHFYNEIKLKFVEIRL